MAKKYIEAEKLIAEIERLKDEYTDIAIDSQRGWVNANSVIDDLEKLQSQIDSLQQEQPEFPTTDEQVKEFLATHPKIKVPEKYKNLDWLFKKQEQPEVDLEKEIDACWQNWLSPSNQKEVEGVLPKTEFATYARHFYKLGLNAREKNK